MEYGYRSEGEFPVSSVKKAQCWRNLCLAASRKVSDYIIVCVVETSDCFVLFGFLAPY